MKALIWWIKYQVCQHPLLKGFLVRSWWTCYIEVWSMWVSSKHTGERGTWLNLRPWYSAEPLEAGWTAAEVQVMDFQCRWLLGMGLKAAIELTLTWSVDICFMTTRHYRTVEKQEEQTSGWQFNRLTDK